MAIAGFDIFSSPRAVSTHLGLASTISSMGLSTGTLRDRIELGSLKKQSVTISNGTQYPSRCDMTANNINLMIPLSSFRLYPSARLSLSETCYLVVNWVIIVVSLILLETIAFAPRDFLYDSFSV